ncbi:MAG: NAD(P)H-quinone oxidoreductase [Maricaulaceae bacterium]
MTDAGTTGRGVFAREGGGPDVLEVRQITVADPGPGEVVIKTVAAGVNMPDVFQRKGFYPPPPGASEVLGLECAGHVFKAGADSGFAEGDPVCALVPGGGYADYVLADAGSVLPAPPGMELKHAAGLPETVFTVYANVFEGGRLEAGQTLLVHGGAGGIGTTAIQMGVADGARVLATAGTPGKVELCESLGAARGINYKTEDFTEIVKAEGGADVILDMVGGPYVEKNLAALKDGGRLVLIAFLGGSKAEVDFGPVLRRRLTITGSTLRPRSTGEKRRLRDAIQERVWPWIADGKLRPAIDSEFALDDVRKAHERIDSGEHAGKILLVM